MSVFSDHVQGAMSEALDDAFGDEVTYTPAGGSPIELTAIIGPTEVLLDGAAIVALSHENRDFLVKTAELLVAAAEYEPQIGDTFTEVKGGKTYTYDVLIPDGLKDCWTWADRFRTRRRVHAKLAGVS